ncbi:MAG: hypothetical protein IT226_04655, partial [Flavobacteriales bacterium]|nr:hypothetical protein [Flavobacteriales bacterium]
TGDKTGLIDGMGVTAMIDLGNARLPAVPTAAVVNSDGLDYVFIHTEDAHDHADADAHDHANEGSVHADGEEAKDHDHAHADAEGHDHSGAMRFQRVQVKRGVSRDGWTAVTFLQPVPTDAEVVINGAYYLMAMMTNSGEHSH